MVTNFDPNQPTSWGTRIFTGANGLSTTSQEASVYGGGGGATNTPTRTPTRTASRTFTPTGPTRTSTRTPTRSNTPSGTTVTPTRTPTRTPTGGTGTACSPVTSTITAPFVYDGAGTFCWRSNNLGTYINSWNLANLTINGVSYTNRYAFTSTLPAKLSDGYWYISYTGNYAWSHFEAK
jgi:mannan endo-1,4-beta-mannosidase